MSKYDYIRCYFDRACAIRRDKARQRHRAAGYPGEFRLALDGVVVSNNKWTLRLEKHFFDHLVLAFTKPETFSFDGCGCQYRGTTGAAQWLEFHRVRLKLDNWDDVEIKLIGPEGNTIEAFTTTGASACP